jgi:hypothetical protein
MKKTFLLFIAAYISTSCFAQRTVHTYATPTQSINSGLPATTGTTSRTTAVGDTLTLTNIAPLDPLTLIQYVSGATGFVAGTNSYNDMGFAERYYFNGSDSSMKVIGVMAQFGGKVNAASTKSINFRVWNLTTPVTVTSTIKYEGYPKDILNTRNVPFTQLGVGPTAITDTMKAFSFDTATKALNGAFFIGYDMAYDFSTLSGDTIGLASTANGHRTIPAFHVLYTLNPDSLADTTHRDTIINVQNATQYADGIWHENYTQNDSIFNDLAVFPIVIIANPTGLNSVVKNNLSLFGNFPNPATNSTNVKFALTQNADVTIKLLDMAGRELSRANYKSLAVGTHTIAIPTNELPTGNYIYTIQTSAGDALAGQMSVVK